MSNEKVWFRGSTSHGDAEFRLTGDLWSVHVRPDSSQSFRVSATGSMSGTAATFIPSPDEEIRVGALSVLPATRQAFYAEEPIHLTPSEFSVLSTMIAQPRRVFSKQELAVSRDIIQRLRKKLAGDFVFYKRGQGWSLVG